MIQNMTKLEIAIVEWKHTRLNKRKNYDRKVLRKVYKIFKITKDYFSKIFLFYRKHDETVELWKMIMNNGPNVWFDKVFNVDDMNFKNLDFFI